MVYYLTLSKLASSILLLLSIAKKAHYAYVNIKATVRQRQFQFQFNGWQNCDIPIVGNSGDRWQEQRQSICVWLCYTQKCGVDARRTMFGRWYIVLVDSELPELWLSQYRFFVLTGLPFVFIALFVFFLFRLCYPPSSPLQYLCMILILNPFVFGLCTLCCFHGLFVFVPCLEPNICTVQSVNHITIFLKFFGR